MKKVYILSFIALILVSCLTAKKNNVTKKDATVEVFAPLEVLSKVNRQEFERFQNRGKASQAERDFIEQSIWYPNHMEIKRIIMTNSHLLSEIPQEFLDLLDHINLWLFIYELNTLRKYIPGLFMPGRAGSHIREVLMNIFIVKQQNTGWH